ncbi:MULTISPECIES: 23S rRNA (adenine(1618)-N(6))-methyltransferase RlmF [unclassified Pseudoalteromonas]|uniref:23S rRNA (adenine(1618)-N(6))-methyltransferase RlmF n=1 Tax=unclassified Pseudoalteromonas TaxID=194690 RepID=UPI00110B455B|nr:MULTISPECIES: 23S rRNA (adenine(1618)-N(6))-methyltransferase RlmF [unclassified Pseudoalteromonas]TMP43052.1 23S rRNA (adenine(1618)-N(6))-methyltransferase RlmF [Pseudoalteromonas sp. S1650]TMP67249.1 23S rRNA (adenine(1618)-N(6))-methyltransferase RlmF [Pseudoalteromonas sp. S1649]
MHPRNRHFNGYDFTLLCKDTPALTPYITQTPAGTDTIDFTNALAVKTLNQALLKSHYKIDFWDLPDNYLCPPVPGRVDYIHHLADLLASDNQGHIPTGKQVKVLDVGTGANVIYPLTGNHEYGWHFTGSDIDVLSVKIAKQIVQFNRLKINVKQQSNANKMFTGVISNKDVFHLTLCNPPFHASEQQANAGTERKWKNLNKAPQKALNFGGRQNELWCEGGEREFISKMCIESQEFAEQCIWFTSLVSKSDTLPHIKKLLSTLDVKEVKVIKMAQGQKISRFIAWSYFDQADREAILNELV